MRVLLFMRMLLFLNQVGERVRVNGSACMCESSACASACASACVSLACACVHVKMSSSPLPNYHFPEKNWKVTRRRKRNEKHKKCDLLRPKNSMHASETFPGKNVVIEKSLN